MRTVAFSAVFLATGIASALAADPTGDWRVADGVANIRVAECNGNMWGAVAWEKTPGGRDKNNPDVSKQSRPTLGMPILIAMKKKPAVDQWEGQVYNAKDGQMYSHDDQAGRLRSDGDSRLRARLPLRRRDLDARLGPDPLEPRQQHGQGRAEGHGDAAEERAAGDTPGAAGDDRCAEDHRRRQPGSQSRVRSRRPASPVTSAISAYSPTSRGLPISAGWNSSTAASVMTNESASSLPMLAVPG